MLVRVNGEKARISLHRAVLYAFVGPPPTPSHQAAHLDGDPKNNRLDNLEWVTPKENSAHKWAHDTMVRGERAVNSTLRDEDITSIRALGHRGISPLLIGGMFDIDKSTVHRILRGETHVPIGVPDLGDPATCGCLWRLIQDHWRDESFYGHRVEWSSDPDGDEDVVLYWEEPHTGGERVERLGVACTGGEALARALLACWGAS